MCKLKCMFVLTNLCFECDLLINSKIGKEEEIQSLLQDMIKYM